MARILVIDDSAVQRIFAKATLESDGHEVVEASGGEEGIALVHQESFDCVLLDWLMPEASGGDVLRAMHDIQPMLHRVIVVTGLSDDAVKQECESLGAAAIIEKPRDQTTLRDAVNSVLSNHDNDPG